MIGFRDFSGFFFPTKFPFGKVLCFPKKKKKKKKKKGLFRVEIPS